MLTIYYGLTGDSDGSGDVSSVAGGDPTVSTAKQRQELEAVLAGRQPRAAVAAAIEERLGEARRCPHCGGASGGRGPNRRPAPFPLQGLPQKLQCARPERRWPDCARRNAGLILVSR